MDEEALIMCVQDFPNLYDWSHTKYHDNNFNLKCWREIGERLNQPAKQCKYKWKLLRECYRKSLHYRGTKSGQTSKKLKPWRLEQQMEFVKQFVNIQRGQENNMSDDELDLTSATCDILLDQNYPEAIETPSAEIKSAFTGAEPASPTGGCASTDPGPFFTENGEVSRKTKTRVSHELSGVSWKKPKAMATEIAAFFQEYLKSPDVGHAHADHLTKYFQAVEETVRTFPKELQIRVKSNISRIVHDAELEAISIPE